MREDRNGCLETIRDSEALVQELRTELASAECRNAEMAKKLRHEGNELLLFMQCFNQLERELEVELEMSVGAVNYLDARRATWIPKS